MFDGCFSCIVLFRDEVSPARLEVLMLVARKPMLMFDSVQLEYITPHNHFKKQNQNRIPIKASSPELNVCTNTTYRQHREAREGGGQTISTSTGRTTYID